MREMESDLMRTKSLNKAKLVIKVEGNKSTREIITKSGFVSKLLFMVSIQIKFGLEILSKLWALLKLVGIVKD